jgi:hypothetical protein
MSEKREERGERKGKEKCHKMFGDRKKETFNTCLQLRFYVLKNRK